MTNLELLFWILLICTTYSYFIYPVFLILLSSREEQKSAKPGEDVPVSIIITAHNEEKIIREKLENTLAIKYSYGTIQILVASDSSTDATNEIVKEYANKGVVLVDVQDRLGKENAQEHAIKVAEGEVIVFSDAATILQTDSIDILVSYFTNPEVGAVSSEDVFISDNDEVAGEGLYVKYEMWLRKLESNLRGLVGLSGSFFAARKDVCALWNKNTTSDFNTELNSAKLGYRAVSAPDVKGYYKDLSDKKKEYQRKYRTVIRGITALWINRSVLNPFRYGLFSFQVWSHKVMRWLVPWFMISLLVTSIMLVQEHWVYIFFLVLQIIFYTLALIGLISESAQDRTVFKVPYFFMTVNFAIAQAFLAFLFGKRITVWTPSKR